MINRPNSRAALPNYIPKYSDPDIIKNLVNTEFWKLMFLGSGKASWIFLKAIIGFKMEMFVAPIRAFTRINHGKRTIGIIIWSMSTLMMIAFNTQYLVGYLATFFPAIAPVVPFFLSGEQLHDAVFISVRSTYLKYFWIGYVLIGAIHLLRSYKGLGQSEGDGVHGTSLLYLLLGRRLGVSQAITKIILEPCIWGALGCYLAFGGMDFTFGLFLLIGAACTFFQEARNAVLQYAMQ